MYKHSRYSWEKKLLIQRLHVIQGCIFRPVVSKSFCCKQLRHSNTMILFYSGRYKQIRRRLKNSNRSCFIPGKHILWKYRINSQFARKLFLLGNANYLSLTQCCGDSSVLIKLHRRGAVSISFLWFLASSTVGLWECGLPGFQHHPGLVEWLQQLDAWKHWEHWLPRSDIFGRAPPVSHSACHILDDREQ